MPPLSISEAARQWNVSRATIHRDANTGKLTKTRDPAGKPAVDPAEMRRVYGEPDDRATDARQAGRDTLQQIGQEDVTAAHAALVDSLRQQIAILSQTVAQARADLAAEREERGRLLGIIEGQTRVLTDQRRPGVVLDIVRRWLATSRPQA